MSAQNLDSLSGQGEFHSKIPGSEPMMKGGHKIGVKVGNDAYPEFSAEVHDKGTAPAKDSFRPNAQSEIPGQAHNDAATERTGALDSLPGATSGSVHNETQFGKPTQGGTGSDGTQDGTGVAGHVRPGQSVQPADGSVEGKARAAGADLEGRAGEQKGQRGKSGAAEGGLNWPGAEGSEPVDAEGVAAARP